MEYNAEEKFKFDDSMVDMGDLPAPDVKISPDYFINTALFRSQKVLETEDIKTGSAKFMMFIQHIEVLAKSMGLTTDDYETQIKAYKESPEYTNLKEDYSKHYNLSNFKLFLLLSEVWKQKPVNMRLKV